MKILSISREEIQNNSLSSTLKAQPLSQQHSSITVCSEGSSGEQSGCSIYSLVASIYQYITQCLSCLFCFWRGATSEEPVEPSFDELFKSVSDDIFERQVAPSEVEQNILDQINHRIRKMLQEDGREKTWNYYQQILKGAGTLLEYEKRTLLGMMGWLSADNSLITTLGEFDTIKGTKFNLKQDFKGDLVNFLVDEFVIEVLLKDQTTVITIDGSKAYGGISKIEDKNCDYIKSAILQGVRNAASTKPYADKPVAFKIRIPDTGTLSVLPLCLPKIKNKRFSSLEILDMSGRLGKCGANDEKTLVTFLKNNKQLTSLEVNFTDEGCKKACEDQIKKNTTK